MKDSKGKNLVDVQINVVGMVTLFKEVSPKDLESLTREWKKKYRHEEKPGLNTILSDATGSAVFSVSSAIQQAIQRASGATPGERLRHVRKEMNLTQVELAEKAGTTQANIASIESGNRGLGKELAEKLGNALTVDYRLFL